MRQNCLSRLLLTLLLASCGPQPVPVPTTIPSPTVAVIAHAPEIRFALIGEPHDVNVWELFDESGASYVDYALRAEYWPRLYHLAPPELSFQPLAADGFPSGVTYDGEFLAGSVELRPDLKWTDGSVFTAKDVAFTVNTALAFELGFDWSAFYPRDYIDHAEVVDEFKVKFLFKQAPNVRVWQYGALLGPILQREYWESRINEASSLLPDDALRRELSEARAYEVRVQGDVDDLAAKAAVARFNGQVNRELEGELAKRQNELIYAQNTLNKILEEYAVKMKSARQALYAVDDEAEPTLGAWIPAGLQKDAWVNVVNPTFPFGQPNFDRAIFFAFDSREDAEQALQNDRLDAVLVQNNAHPSGDPTGTVTSNLNGSARFLVFNPSNSALADPALRQAFACTLWSPSRSSSAPLNGFILQGNGFWRNPEAVTPCSDLTDANISDLRWARIIEILKSAGYSWKVEPTKDLSGEGLVMPNGQPFPAVTLLGLSEDENTPGPAKPGFIGDSARKLGIPNTVEYVSTEDIRYEVFSSKKYDMAILGWSLGLYPGYLCEWFGGQGQFNHGTNRLKSECEALEAESDLEAAQKHIFEIQSILVEDLPFIPLCAEIRYDAYRNILYPFESVLGGFGGLYGAPSYAMPAN